MSQISQRISDRGLGVDNINIYNDYITGETPTYGDGLSSVFDRVREKQKKLGIVNNNISSNPSLHIKPRKLPTHITNSRTPNESNRNLMKAVGHSSLANARNNSVEYLPALV